MVETTKQIERTLSPYRVCRPRNTTNVKEGQGSQKGGNTGREPPLGGKNKYGSTVTRLIKEEDGKLWTCCRCRECAGLKQRQAPCFLVMAEDVLRAKSHLDRD